jgi:hypothetical protein
LREQAEQEKLLQQRDQLLTEALNKADCLDIVGGKRYFQDQVKYDEDEGQWKFFTDDGVDLELGEGVKENMPDYQ